MLRERLNCLADRILVEVDILYLYCEDLDHVCARVRITVLLLRKLTRHHFGMHYYWSGIVKIYLRWGVEFRKSTQADACNI